MSNMEKQSVLKNIDKFDNRRFIEIFGMSKQMKLIEEEGREFLPSFFPLMRDVWAGLFKMKPELRKEVEPELQINRHLMERVMAEEGFRHFREHTRLDDLASAIGTIKYSETVLEWMKEQARQNQQFSQALQQAASGDSAAMQQAAQAVAKALDQNGRSLARALQNAANETIQTKENLKSLLGGIQAGSGEAELKKIPLRDQLALAEKLTSQRKLKEIAKWAGRLKLIARKKQQAKHRESIDRSGITIGKQVEKLLPLELAAFSSSEMKLDFLRRFAEGQTLQYDTRGKEQLGKGPIVLCLDQSGSMEDQDTVSKAFVLALMSVARKQGRDFALILFNSRAKEPVLFEKGRITVKDMISLATVCPEGGTDFEEPLRKAAGVIQKSRFKRADIVFVTDGEAHVSDPFMEYWDELKKKKDFRTLSVLLGTQQDCTVKKFSDRVVKAESLLDDAVHQAFEI